MEGGNVKLTAQCVHQCCKQGTGRNAGSLASWPCAERAIQRWLEDGTLGDDSCAYVTRWFASSWPLCIMRPAQKTADRSSTFTLAGRRRRWHVHRPHPRVGAAHERMALSIQDCFWKEACRGQADTHGLVARFTRGGLDNQVKPEVFHALEDLG